MIQIGNKINSEILRDRNIVLTDINSNESKLILKKYNIVLGDFETADIRIRPIPLIQLVTQASLETGNGSSKVYKQYNNAFGLMKSKTEYRKYKSVEEGARFYALNLNRNVAYKQYRQVRYNGDDITLMLRALKVYAEDPNYIKLLNELKTSL
jgi:Bax protein